MMIEAIRLIDEWDVDENFREEADLACRLSIQMPLGILALRALITLFVYSPERK
jgi:hypothetical protein